MDIQASYHQERLWFIDQFETGNIYKNRPVYHNIPLILKIKGLIEPEKLEQAINKIIQRHEALQTTIITNEDSPWQNIDPGVNIKLDIVSLEKNQESKSLDNAGEVEDLKTSLNVNQDLCRGEPYAHPVISNLLLEIIIPYSQISFSIENEPLIRGHLFLIERDCAILLITFHHLIADKKSLEIFTRELLEYYSAYIENREASLPDLPIHYADFSYWQRELPEEFIEPQMMYWKRKLQGKIKALQLPTDFERSHIHIYQQASDYFFLRENISRKINCFCQQNEVPRFHFLLSVFKVLLYHYCDQEEIVIGFSSPNRNQPETSHIIGPLANLLVLRSFLQDTTTYLQFLKGIGKDIVNAYQYQDIPFDRLVLELKPEIDMSRTAFFDVLFQFEEEPMDCLYSGDIHIDVFDVNLGWGKYDLNLLLRQKSKGIEGILVYNKEYYHSSTISHFIQHYLTLIEVLLGNPEQEISQLSFLTEKERQKMLWEWNQTKANYPKKSIQQLFQDQVEKTPHAVALICPRVTASSIPKNIGDKESELIKEKNRNASNDLTARDSEVIFTYHHLNQWANRLAHFLLNRYHFKPNRIIGLLMNRSLEMIINILGILKAGGTYLPIDPAYPNKRIKSMLEDCQVETLLTSSSILKKYQHLYTDLQGLHLKKFTLYETPLRAQIKDLDGIQFPDRSLVNYEKYNQHIGQAMVTNCISLQASRGCPYDCAYCHKIWPKTHVFRSAENIIEEIKIYRDMGVKRFSLIDDIFNLNIKNSQRFFQLVIDHQLDIQLFFPSGMRGDLLTKDYIDLMVRAGTTGLALALETPVLRLQQLIRKNLKVDKLRENLTYFCENYPGVILELFTMHGFPTETKEEAQQTLEFIKSLKWIHFPYINILRIYPNTDMERIALEHGISVDAIYRQDSLAQNEFAETLPFDKNFTVNYQAEFLNEYFLSKKRLLHVLPYQMRVLTEKELLQKYNSYLPARINQFKDILELAEIKRDEIKEKEFLDEHLITVPDLNKKLNRHFTKQADDPNALKILLLDLSQQFSFEKNVIYDVIDPPLGFLYLFTYLNRYLGNRVHIKILKSGIDFDNYETLKNKIMEFKPDVIGVRTLTYFKEFFHKTISIIRQWGLSHIIIAGGPYATSDYSTILQDRNIDIVVRGEGEITFYQLIQKILDNNGKMPGDKVLKEVEGIVFVPDRKQQERNMKCAREIVLWDQLKDQLMHDSSVNPMPPLNMGELEREWAYIIFTSGSTGKPKGCSITHGNMARLLKNDGFPFVFNERDVWIMAHSYCFDFSVWEIFGSLLNGAQLVLPSWEEVRETVQFHSLIQKYTVTVLNQTPGAFYQLIRYEMELPRHGLNRHLRYVIFGGDQLNPSFLKDWIQFYLLEEIALVNMYGITETTVHVTFYRLKMKDIEVPLSASPIGKPLPETTLYILNKNLNLTPVKLVGEIYVGGSGLANGYVNRPELTQERFMMNPFKRGELIYKSGDLGKWIADGNIEYIGRMDNQVKIRGYRIEFAEIEAKLNQHPKIKDVTVALKEIGIKDKPLKLSETYLSAYYCSEEDLLHAQLKSYLKRELPDYMIPSFFIRIEQIPLTLNGKIDRQSLPLPEIEGRKENYTAPRNEIDERLIQIWSEVLGVDSAIIGIDSDFFELGGHSLKATLIIAKIQQILHVKIPLVELFKTPTIRGLYASLLGQKKEVYDTLKATEKREYYHLSSAQKRVYILEQLNPIKAAKSNISEKVILEGRIDKKRLQQAFSLLIQRHESLRTSFQLICDEPVQQIHHEVDFNVDYDHQKEESVIVEGIGWNYDFDLSHAPLLRVGLIKLDGGQKHILMVAMHHIISDGISHSLLQQEFMSIYNKKFLAPLKFQYRDYSQWQKSENQTGVMKQQEKYWINQFPGELPLLDLPYDFERKKDKDIKTKGFDFMLDSEETLALKEMAKQEQTSLYMVLLAIYDVLLAKLSGQEDIIVGTMTAGRGHPDLEKIIGMFVNTLALRTKPKAEKTFKDFLKEVKNTTLDAFENQDYQFEDLVDQLNIPRNVTRNPLFDTKFILQNVEFSEIKMMDLTISPFNEPENQELFGILDIELTAYERGERIYLYLKYNESLFKHESIEIYSKYFQEILSTVLRDINIQLKDIALSSELMDLVESSLEEDLGDFDFQ